MSTARRKPLARVLLTGRSLTFHRALQSTAALFALVALATLFFPMHEVRDTGFGEGLACAFMTDCHTARVPVSEAEILARPPDQVHTGLDHGGALAVALFLALAAGELLSLWRARFWVGLPTACAAVLLGGVALVATEIDLSHMFEHVRRLPAGRIHETAVLGLALAALVDALAQPLLYIRARWSEAHAASPPFPAARTLKDRQPSQE